MTRIEFIPGADAPVELLHFVAGLAMRLARDGMVIGIAPAPRLDLDVGDAIARVAPTTLRDERAILVRPDDRPSAAIELIDDSVARIRRPGGQAEVDIPLALDPATFPGRRPAGEKVFRVLFRSCAHAGRRERMTLRVLEEMRSRRLSYVAVSYGNRESKRIASLPGELHSDLTAREWATLVVGASCILECTDARERPSSAPAAGIAAGVAVVTFAGAAEIAETSAIIRAEAWSADAFCDALCATAGMAIAPSSAPFDRALERFREAIDAG